MSRHERAIKKELEMEQRLRPIELRRMIASFPHLRELLAELWDIVNDADPTTGRAIESNRKGDDIYREIRAADRVGAYRDLMHSVNLRIGKLARSVRDSQPRQRRDEPHRWRRCRREGCELEGRRQSGIWTPDGKNLCKWCHRPMPKGDAKE